MDIRAFDAWCRSFLKIEALSDIDDSLNGIQVECGRQIRKAAFAVDACAESIRRAVDAGADILFVHHGIFWGKPERVSGPLRERLRLLLEADLGLYACHLPLDMHPEVGNNAVLADLLSLGERQPFGSYHSVEIGVSGRFPVPLSMDEIVAKILPDLSRPKVLISSGKGKLSTAAIVSGGAPFEALQAFDKAIDVFITGEPSHSVYHLVVEAGLDFIAAGHYATEVWGVKAVAAKANSELGIETCFIDLPTGL
ncbi:MAG: Nif3-like dinuclear metal center hexameric protein [Spirochaetes bacterium]|nr:Nif3-like dinuclear metal center hexameric protein [Spirochaetota bacterium]